MPIELKKMIVSFLDNEATKHIALTSKEMSLAYEKLWSKPRFKYPKRDIKFLNNISRLPIRELNVMDFSCSWVEIVGIVPNLKLLHIDATSNKGQKSLDTQLGYLKVPVVVHTRSFQLKGENFDNFLSCLEVGATSIFNLATLNGKRP